MAEEIDRGRDVFDRQAWGRAYADLSAAAQEGPLEIDDLERLACAAYLVARSDESSDVWARACGELARGGGWVDRAQRLLDDRRIECVEQGYLRYAAGLRSIFSGDVAGAHTAFAQAVAMGELYRDPELTTLARIGQGRCAIYLGEADRGIALLDEAMVAVGARAISPIAVGDAYCTVIEGCHELFDVRRAEEWTAALAEWCDAQPELVLYRGECVIHRAEIMQLHGAWSDALEEAQRACSSGKVAQPRALAAATYLEAELHRVRGEFGPAEDAYRRANDLGREPQPGLALLRLAQGRPDAAGAAIRRVLHEAEDPISRMRILGPYVDIVLSEGEFAAARVASEELSTLATGLNQPFLVALDAHVTGSVLLAADEPAAALGYLRRAWRGWRQLEARTKRRGLECSSPWPAGPSGTTTAPRWSSTPPLRRSRPRRRAGRHPGRVALPGGRRHLPWRAHRPGGGGAGPGRDR